MNKQQFDQVQKVADEKSRPGRCDYHGFQGFGESEASRMTRR